MGDLSSEKKAAERVTCVCKQATWGCKKESEADGASESSMQRNAASKIDHAFLSCKGTEAYFDVNSRTSERDLWK